MRLDYLTIQFDSNLFEIFGLVNFSILELTKYLEENYFELHVGIWI